MELPLFTEIDYRLWGALTRARDLALKARGSDLGRYGISSIEAFVLYLLYGADEHPTPAQLSRKMLREHNTVTALLRRMENKGLVERRRDPDKKNTWRVRITEQGAEVCRNAMKIDSLHYMMGSFSETEKESLETYLKRIADRALMLGITDFSEVPEDRRP